MRRLSLLLLVLMFSGSAFSQNWRYYRHELFAGVGASQFLGELGGNNGPGVDGFESVKDLDLALTRPVISIGYRYKISPLFAVRATFTQARVDGDDERTDDPWRKNRNLHFKSPISELSAMFEFYPLGERVGHPYRMNGASGKKIRHLSPYLFGGIGGFFFNPKAQFERNGDWMALHDFQTEGEDYSRISAAISYGGGLKYSLNRQWSIGFEFGLRKTFTDYIDDVSTVYVDNSTFATDEGKYFADPSLRLPEATTHNGPISAGEQRGNSEDLDSYMFAIFSVHYRLLKGRLNLPKF